MSDTMDVTAAKHIITEWLATHAQNLAQMQLYPGKVKCERLVTILESMNRHAHGPGDDPDFYCFHVISHREELHTHCNAREAREFSYFLRDRIARAYEHIDSYAGLKRAACNNLNLTHIPDQSGEQIHFADTHFVVPYGSMSALIHARPSRNQRTIELEGWFESNDAAIAESHAFVSNKYIVKGAEPYPLQNTIIPLLDMLHVQMSQEFFKP